MSNIKIIVFDLGNVLIPFDYSKITRRLDEVEQGLGDRFLKFYAEHYKDIHRAFERGDISEDEFLNPILEKLEYKVDRETFCRYFSEIFTVNEDVAALLPALKRNYRLCLLSNTSQLHRRYGWGHYEFLQHFEKLFLSDQVKAVKPEPEIYKAVVDYTHEGPAAHLFIDDVAEYVESAKKSGWHAIQFTGYPALNAALLEKGIIF